MNKPFRRLALPLLLALPVTPALAGHCPLDAGVIDDALDRSTLPAETREQIRSLREQGMELHNAGQHGQSEDRMAEAMRMLLKGGLEP